MGSESLNLGLPKSNERNTEVDCAAGAVHEHGRTAGLSVRTRNSLDSFQDRAPGRHDVVDHQNPLAFAKSLPPPEYSPGSISVTLGIDRAYAQLTRDFLRDQDSTGGRPGHRFKWSETGSRRFGNSRTQPRCQVRMLKDAKFL